MTGLSFILFFSNHIFRMLSFNTYINLVLCFPLLLGTILCSMLIESTGRKTLIMIGMSIEAVCLLLISLLIIYDFNNLYVLILMCITMFAHGLASGPIPWIFDSDILPDIGVALS